MGSGLFLYVSQISWCVVCTGLPCDESAYFIAIVDHQIDTSCIRLLFHKHLYTLYTWELLAFTEYWGCAICISSRKIRMALDHLWGKPQLLAEVARWIRTFIGKMVVPLGWRAPSCLTPARSLLKGDILIYPTNTHYRVYMGLFIQGTIPRVPPFSLWDMGYGYGF